MTALLLLSRSSRALRRSLAAVAVLVGASSLSGIAMADPGQIQQPAPGIRIRARHASRDAAEDLLGVALRDVKLRPDQRAQIEPIKKEATSKRAALRAAKRALLEATASQIEAARFDRVALKRPIDAVLLAWADDSRAERGALDKLHVVLEKEQREQLSNAIEAQLGHDGHDGHDGRDGREGRDDAWEGGDVRRLGEDLKLDKEQRHQLSAWFKEQAKGERESHSQAKERERRLLEAFKGDKYQSEQAYPAAAARARPQEEVDRFIAVAEQLHPVLTVEQRAIAATMLRDRATSGAALRF